VKVVDIHPEELIDKLTAGELSGAQRERLDAHLAQCSSCRFEISVRRDLEQDAPLFEQRPQLSFAGRQAAPLAAARGSLLEQGTARAPASVRPRSRRRWPLVLLAASLVLCAGGAMAAVITGAVVAPAWLHWAPAPKAADVAVRVADAKLERKVTRALKLAAPSTAIEGTPAVVSSSVGALAAPSALPGLPVENPRPVLVSRRAPPALVLPAPARVSSEVPSIAAFPSAPAEPPTSADQPAPVDAAPPHLDPSASLFADANRARRDGNVDRAVALYRSLQSRYPRSSESQLSRALLAQLLLDRGSPEQALAGFDRYLSEGAPVLGAEALVGRARALEQLGKPEQAAVAWKQVQSRFPGSVHARLAAARLAALGMR
jgi:TolA-binding protein